MTIQFQLLDDSHFLSKIFKGLFDSGDFFIDFVVTIQFGLCSSDPLIQIADLGIQVEIVVNQDNQN
jgi:hypothetical protein